MDEYDIVTGFVVGIVFVVTVLILTSGDVGCESCSWAGDWDECEIVTETRIANRTDTMWGTVYQVEETWKVWKCPECGEVLREEMLAESRLW